MDDSIRLIHGDCMEVLPTLADKQFDLAIVDPPYFSGPERRGYYGSNVSTSAVARHKYPVTAHWHVPGKEYFAELSRVARHYIVWGCNYFQHIFAPGRIVWDKCNGKSSFSDCEIAATDLISSARLYPFMWNGMCQGKSMNDGRTMQGNKKLNERRIHPTQKPVALYQWLLAQYAKPGWKILDTHLGSGSIAIACTRAGHEMLGIEIEVEYYRLACERLDAERRRLTLFTQKELRHGTGV